MKKTSLRFVSAVLATAIAIPTFAGIVDENKSTVNPQKALSMLKEGNDRFASGQSKYPHSDVTRREEVAKGQKPFASILSCADSRLSPELIFDQGLGDVFVARVAGNTFGKDILGSIEYSVAVLGSRLIVVMGHERCGAVDAAIKGGKLPGSIPDVVAPIQTAVRTTKDVHDHRLDKTIAENVKIQVKRMATQSKILGDMVKKGELKIVGGVYDLDSGKVTWL